MSEEAQRDDATATVELLELSETYGGLFQSLSRFFFFVLFALFKVAVWHFDNNAFPPRRDVKSKTAASWLA